MDTPTRLLTELLRWVDEKSVPAGLLSRCQACVAAGDPVQAIRGVLYEVPGEDGQTVTEDPDKDWSPDTLQEIAEIVNNFIPPTARQ